MPNPYSNPSPWPVSLIIIAALSGVIICALTGYLIYYLTESKNQSTPKVPGMEEIRTSQITLKDVLASSLGPMEAAGRVHLGMFNTRRLPLLATSVNSAQSVHPYVSDDRFSGSNARSDGSNQSKILRVSDDRLQTPHTVGDSETLCTATEELRPGLPVSKEQTENQDKIDFPIKHDPSGLGLSPERSGGEVDGSLSPAVSSGDLESHQGIESVQRFPEFRLVQSAIVETTEKKTPTQIIRKKLLSLVSSPANQRLVNSSDEDEVKYYWEIMQIQSNDTWWQLPFPPQISPIKPTFEIEEPDL